MCDVVPWPVLGYVPHRLLRFVSVIPETRVVTMTYEHVNRAYSECLESPKVFDSNKVLGIPSVTDGTTAQFTIGKMEPGNSRRI